MSEPIMTKEGRKTMPLGCMNCYERSLTGYKLDRGFFCSKRCVKESRGKSNADV